MLVVRPGKACSDRLLSNSPLLNDLRLLFRRQVLQTFVLSDQSRVVELLPHARLGLFEQLRPTEALLVRHLRGGTWTLGSFTVSHLKLAPSSRGGSWRLLRRFLGAQPQVLLTFGHHH